VNRFPLTTMKIKSVSLPLQMGEGGGGQKGLGPLPFTLLDKIVYSALLFSKHSI
jgi:hypothetical protein